MSEQLDEYANQRSAAPRYNSSRSKDDEREMALLSTLNKKLMFRGWKFDPSIHASAQAYERRPDFKLDDWKKIHLRTWEKVDALAEKTAKSGYYLFYSKSLMQGYVTYVDFRNQEVRIVTVLPKGRNKAKDDTTFVLVEGLGAITIEAEYELD